MRLNKEENPDKRRDFCFVVILLLLNLESILIKTQTG